ncbi:MAG: tetratricopeptide repeat protein [Muribaculaceae bacterium]|nr:tetratricopeptide repeat protein [Muribaculaceae bacterium]
MKYLCTLLAVLLSAAAYAVEPSVPDDEEDPYFLLCGQADKAIAEGDYEEAAARLVDAMTVRPASAENILLMSNLGLIYSYLDRDSLALATLDEAHRRAPAMRTVLLNRARVLLKTGRDKEAQRDFGAVIATDSLNREARFYHGTIALYSGNLDEAEKDFAVLKSVAPDDTDTARGLSALYSMTNRDKEAIPYFEKLIKYEPSAEYYAGLAGCQLALQQLSEASATLSDGIKKYPLDPELYYYRAMLNRDRYSLKEAHADAAKAVKLGLSPARAKALFKE